MWAGVWLHAGLGVLRLVGMCGVSGVCVRPPGGTRAEPALARRAGRFRPAPAGSRPSVPLGAYQFWECGLVF